jgi:hypothetical protein
MNLDVSLHDDVLADELELTARLMIAANESEAPLSTGQLDRILGTVAAAMLPVQRTTLSTAGY